MSILAYPFMQHAILAAVLCSIACGIIGSLVVLNRLSYLAGAVAHAAYGGIGIAFLFALPVLPCTLGFSLAASLLMARIMIKDGDIAQNNRTDTAIGILWAAGMAFGIILIELSPGYAGDMMGFLFGSILAVPRENLWLTAGLDLALALMLLRFHQGLTAVSLDPDFARARGLPVQGLLYLLVGMASIAFTISFSASISCMRAILTRPISVRPSISPVPVGS